MPTLKLCMLGAFQVTRAGAHLSHFRSDKVRALLAYLATEAARPHPRTALATLLWPALAADAALRNLSQTLVRLREALGDATETSLLLDISRATIQWRGAAAAVDVLDFARLARSSDPADLAEAATLYGGEFLPGFDLPDAEPFEEWLLLTRESLQQQALATLQTLAGHYLAARHWAEAAAAARHQIALDPWRETGHRQLMQALAAAGDRAAALAQFASCRTVLAADLGVEPDEQTRALYERILANQPAPDRAVPFSPRPGLPAALTSFVGREADLRALASLRQQPDVRLLTLLGAGGMGKTRLALEAARAASSRYADGVYFVPLAPLAGAEAIPSAIALAIGVTLPGSDLDAALLRLLRDQQMLLLLDNCEHLLPGASIVAAILAAAPRVQIIATSRERLNVRGEQVYVVEGLEYNPSQQPGDREATPALRLLLQSARRAAPGFVAAPADLAALERICALVQGMPLGLELAAAWIGLLAPQAIATEIERSLDFLQADWLDAPARQRSMRAVFEWSWRLLGDDERRVLAALAVFRGGFTRDAAEAVAGATLRVLAGLAHKSLLRWSPGRGPGRYDQHELLRQFAREKLGESPAEDEVRQAHATFFAALAGKSEPGAVQGPTPTESLAQLQQDYDNLRAALAWALEGMGRGQAAPTAIGLRLVGALWRFWYFRGYWVEGGAWLDAVLAHRTSGNTSAFAGALYGAGLIALEQGDYPRARHFLAESLLAYRQAGDVAHTALVLGRLGDIAYAAGDYVAAQPLMEEALAQARGTGNKLYITGLLSNLGELRRTQGDHAAARQLNEEGLALLAELGDKGSSTWSTACCNLGSVILSEGDCARAAALFRESLTISEKLGHVQEIALCVLGLAGVAGTLQQPLAAARLFGAAEKLLEMLGAKLWPADRRDYEHHRAATQAQLGAAEFAQARQDGRAMSLAQAIRAARELAAVNEERLTLPVGDPLRSALL